MGKKSPGNNINILIKLVKHQSGGGGGGEIHSANSPFEFKHYADTVENTSIMESLCKAYLQSIPGNVCVTCVFGELTHVFCICVDLCLCQVMSIKHFTHFTKSTSDNCADILWNFIQMLYVLIYHTISWVTFRWFIHLFEPGYVYMYHWTELLMVYVTLCCMISVLMSVVACNASWISLQCYKRFAFILSPVVSYGKVRQVQLNSGTATKTVPMLWYTCIMKHNAI